MMSGAQYAGLIRSARFFSRSSKDLDVLYLSIKNHRTQNDWDSLVLAAQEGVRKAKTAAHPRMASRFLYGLAMAQYMRQRYDRSVQAAFEGRDLAIQAADWQMASLNSYALAVNYYYADSPDLMYEAGQDVLRYALRARTRTFEARGVLGAILARRGDMEGAIREYRQALQEAEREADPKMIADSLEQIGLALLATGRVEEAESELVEAFRLRRMHAPQVLGWSYSRLGRLRLAQGRAREAVSLLDAALASASSGLLPHSLLYDRARALVAMGREDEAYDSLRRALEAARVLRAHLPFGDALQISSEQKLQEIYALFIEMAAARCERTRDTRYAREAFEAAQENRAASLRSRLAADGAWRERLPSRYWKKLAELRTVEVAALRSGRRIPSAAQRRLRAELAEMESAAGAEIAEPERFRRANNQPESRLETGEALISFHIGQHASYAWLLDQEGIQQARLEPRESLGAKIEVFRRAVEAGEPSHLKTGLELFRGLFLPLAGAARNRVWTLVPDDALFTLPFGALVTGHRDGRPVYLAEEHVLRLAPTAFPLRSTTPDPPASGFAGVGDPVNNRADVRWPGHHAGWWGSPAKFIARGVEMPRLPGSADELSRCARGWPRQFLLTGSEITEEALGATLSRHPRVLHFATHVYTSSGEWNAPAIALGLSTDGSMRTLTDSGIAVMPNAPPFVTLSGCSSGRGTYLSGTGLLGLTRSWLMAGSHAVVASLWPTADAGGELFEAYYAHLREGPARSSLDAARALQRAQKDSLLRGGWSASPSCWGAYFVIGSW